MRVVLLVGLTATLGALVAFGATVVRRRTPPPAEQPAEDPPEPPPHTPAAREFRRRELTPIEPPACVPQPGRACWRGHLKLSAATRETWFRRRQARQSREEAEWGEAVEREGELALSGVERAQWVSDKAPLPPDGPFTERFEVTAVPRDDQPAADDAGDRETIEGDVEADGAFELQLPPGRYDLEVKSDDDLLVGGKDDLVARAGAVEAGLDVEVAPSVTIAGWVVDDDGNSADGDLQLSRLHRSEGTVFSTNQYGAFRRAGLRPGTYRLTATISGVQSATLTVVAPSEGIRLRVTRVPAGLLMIAPDEAGRCPEGTLVLAGGDQKIRTHFHTCQSVLPRVFPNVRYHVTGRLGGRTYDTNVTFQGSPPAPVCLDPWCGTPGARLMVRAVDAHGDPASADVFVCVAGGACSDPTHAALVENPLDLRLKPGDAVFLRAVQEGLGAGEAAVRILPGVNEVLIRLPGAATEPAERAAVESEDDEG